MLYYHRVNIILDFEKPKTQYRGLFPGAQVKRGIDWLYGDEVSFFCIHITFPNLN